MRSTVDLTYANLISKNALYIKGYPTKKFMNLIRVDLALKSVASGKTINTFMMESFWMYKFMATLTIKNMHVALYQDLKHQAMLNHRSLNSEAIVSLAKQFDAPLITQDPKILAWFPYQTSQLKQFINKERS